MFLTGGSGKDKLTGGAGADTLYGLGGDDSLSGLGGEDVLAGNDGNDSLSGGADDDYLMGGLGNDRIDGGTGNDWAGYEDATSAVKVDLALTTAQNTLGAGTDQLSSIEYVYGSSYGDTLSGTTGANYIFGGDGNDSLVGRAGDDFLAGGAGNDTIDGGANDDTVSFDDGIAAGVVVNLVTQTADGHGHDSLVSIESVYGGIGSDSIVGNDVDNYLFGGAGDDTILAAGGADYVDGDAGNDLLKGGAGDDYVLGGDGVDTFSFDDGVVGGVTVSLLNQVADGHGHDVLVSIENVIGSGYDDTITGDAAANVLTGGDGADSLSGGDGADTFIGGRGNDYMNGGAGTDMVSFLDGATHGVTIDGGVTYAEGINTLVSIEGAIGTQFADYLQGNPGDNSFFGMGGDDILNGDGMGQDVLDGGDGDDLLVIKASSNFSPSGNTLLEGGQGFDTVNYYLAGSPSTGITVDLGAAGPQTIFAGQTATLSSVEGVIGSAMSDIFYAGAATNTFTGAGGDDRFVFSTGDTSTIYGQMDLITDFSAGDKLDVGVAVTAGNMFSGTVATSYAQALADASSLINGGVRDVVVIGVYSGAEAGTYVFADAAHNNTLGVAIKLTGAYVPTLGDFA